MNAVRKKLAAGKGAEVVHWINICANALLARGARQYAEFLERHAPDNEVTP